MSFLKEEEDVVCLGHVLCRYNAMHSKNKKLHKVNVDSVAEAAGIGVRSRKGIMKERETEYETDRLTSRL